MTTSRDSNLRYLDARIVAVLTLLLFAFAGCARGLSWSSLQPSGSTPATSDASHAQPSPEPDAQAPETSADPEDAEDLSESSSGSSRRESSGAAGAEDTASSSSPSLSSSSSGAAPTRVSVQIRSSCSATVKVLYAERSTDTNTRIDPGEVESHTFDIGAQLWVLDSSEHKLASATISASTSELTIGSDCTSVVAR